MFRTPPHDSSRTLDETVDPPPPYEESDRLNTTMVIPQEETMRLPTARSTTNEDQFDREFIK